MTDSKPLAIFIGKISVPVCKYKDNVLEQYWVFHLIDNPLYPSLFVLKDIFQTYLFTYFSV